jgi:uncharacterized protein YjbI with pentapeptide repeats
MDREEKPKKSWRERIVKIAHWCLLPFRLAERACEGLSKLLGRWAFLEIMEYLGRLAVLVVVIFWFLESDDRKQAKQDQRKAKQYQAWQVINSAQGQKSSGGRIDALQDLVKDGVSLKGIDISNANLPRIELRNANLAKGNFSEAYLAGSNLSGANLGEANLFRTNLFITDLSETNLYKANLSGAVLLCVDLSGANLGEANLSEAKLYKANLSGADLRIANLSGASLPEANLKNANLLDVEHWQSIKSIKLANIHGVENPPEGFIEWAKKQGAVSIENRYEWQKYIREQ